MIGVTNHGEVVMFSSQIGRFLTSTAVAVAVMTVTGCCINPAGSAFRKAEELAADGQYDEAIAAYEEVASKYPKSEEAALVPDAITDTMIARTGALWNEGRWVECGRSFFEVSSRFGDLATAVEAVEGATGTDAALAAVYVENLDTGPTDEAIDGMTLLFERYGDRVPAGLHEEAAAWLCGNRASFPSYSACRDVDPVLEGRGSKEMVLEIYDRYEAARTSCTLIGRLGEVCDDEVRAEISALPAGNLASFERAIREREPGWKKETKEEWKILLSGLRDQARFCEDMKVESRRMIQTGLGTDREAAEFYWTGVGTGIIKPDAEIPKLIKNYHRQFTSDTLVLVKAMKRDYWPEECNKAVVGLSERMFQDCVMTGAPADTSYITSFIPEECPHSPLPPPDAL